MTVIKINAFNIRVYGLFINKKNEILLADEERYGMQMTKFPGGGLQFGEGTIDCLKREALEEMGQEIEITGHFYTTDFFQTSAFNQEHQLLSVYYLSSFKENEKFRLSDTKYDFNGKTGEIISFRYQSLQTLKEEDLSFPADRLVLKLLKGK
jgi:8-oxo-dGTP diphosphatase